MSAVVGIRARAKLRLQIASLRLLQRAFNNPRLQRFLFRPLIGLICHVWLYTFAVRMVFGYTPKWAMNPLFAEQMQQLQALRDRPVSRTATDRDRALAQKITWGVAGGGVLILVSIVATTKQFGPAMTMATVCFSLAIPILFGLGLTTEWSADARFAAPSVQQTIKQTAKTYGANLLFICGLAALLWSYKHMTGAVFVVGCYIAWRGVKRYALKHALPPQP
jgi:hypothetical protein